MRVSRGRRGDARTWDRRSANGPLTTDDMTNEHDDDAAGTAARSLSMTGDITKLDTDAIVKRRIPGCGPAAGSAGRSTARPGRHLRRRASGRGAVGSRARSGQAAITPGGALRARHVIHAVGPIHGENPAKAPRLLAAAYVQFVAAGARKRACAASRFRASARGSSGIRRTRRAGSCSMRFDEDLEKHGGLEKVVFCVFGKDGPSSDTERGFGPNPGPAISKPTSMLPGRASADSLCPSHAGMIRTGRGCRQWLDLSDVPRSGKETKLAFSLLRMLVSTALASLPTECDMLART